MANTAPDSGPISQQAMAEAAEAAGGPVAEVAMGSVPMFAAGPITETAMGAIPVVAAGPVVGATMAAIPSVAAGPSWEEDLVTFPSQFAGGIVNEALGAQGPFSTGPVSQQALSAYPTTGQVVAGQSHEEAMGELLIPPPPPVPPPNVIEPKLADDALVTEFDSDANKVVVIQGGSEEPTELNTLTEAQYAFLQARQRGVDGSLPQTQIGRFTGPAFPFGPSWQLTLGPKTDFEVIFTSLVNIITTSLGSLPYAPLSGSEVPNLVFEPNDAITHGLIRYFVVRDLELQEPRARIVNVRTWAPPESPYTVVVTIAFQIVGDPLGRVFSAPVEFNTLSIAV